MSSLVSKYLPTVRLFFEAGQLRSITVPNLGRCLRSIRIRNEQVRNFKAFSVSNRNLAERIACILAKNGSLQLDEKVNACPPPIQREALFKWRTGMEALPMAALQSLANNRRTPTKPFQQNGKRSGLRPPLMVLSVGGNHGGIHFVSERLHTAQNATEYLEASSIFIALLEKRPEDARSFVTNFDDIERRRDSGGGISLCPGFCSGRPDVFGGGYDYWPPLAAIAGPDTSRTYIHNAAFLFRGCPNSWEDPEFQKFPEHLINHYYARGQSFEIW